MKKNILLYIFICSFFSFSSLGQNATLLVGDDFHESERWKYNERSENYFLYKGKTADGYYLTEVLEYKSVGYFATNVRITFRKLDTVSLQSVQKSTIDLRKFHKNVYRYRVSMNETRMTQDSLIVLYTVFDIIKDVKRLMKVSCSHKNLIFSEPKPIFTKNKLHFQVTRKLEENQEPEVFNEISLTYSDNKALTLMHYSRPKTWNRKRQVHSFQVWTSDFSRLVWEKDIKINHFIKRDYPYEMIDSLGNVYVYYTSYGAKKEVSLLRVSESGDQVSFNKLDFSIYQPHSTLFEFDKEGTLKVFGFYKERKEVLGEYTYDFPLSKSKPSAIRFKNVQTVAAEPRKKEKGEFWHKHATGKHTQYVNNLFRLEDGNTLTVDEEFTYDYNVTIKKDGRSNEVWEEFRYDDIIVTRKDKNGDELWKTRIPKRQYEMGNNQLCSYHIQRVGDILVFLYNENSESVSMRDPEKLKVFFHPFKDNKKRVLVKVTVYPNGEYEKEVLLEYENDGNIPMVMTMEDNGDNQVLVGVKKKKQYSLGKLTW